MEPDRAIRPGIRRDSSRQPRDIYDLAADCGIKITYRSVYQNPHQGGDEKAFYTFAYSACDTGVSGQLKISGADKVNEAKAVSLSDEMWGLAFRLRYVGTRTWFDTTTPVDIDYSFGALYSVIQ